MDEIADGNIDVNITALTATAQKLLARVSQLEETREVSTADLRVAMDTMWVFSCGVEICTMQLGFAMLEAGFVREQNVVATYMKNIVDFLISIFAATMGSYNLAYPDASVFMPEVSTELDHHILRKNYFFHVLFQGTAATIVSGAMAERVAIKGYLAFSVLLSGLVFPMAVRLTWGGGYLRQLDEPFHDFAGSGVVHLLGGSAALVGAILLGSRTGRWDPNQASKWVPHDLSMVLSGMLILWCGWYGFNTGSSLALSDLDTAGIVSTAFVSTTASAAAGGATIVLLSLLWTRGHSIDVLHMVNGILGGLVSITAGCDVISGWHAMIIGMLAALLCMAFTTTIEKLHIDDVCDATGVHGACGLWGLLAVGLFHADKGLFITGNWDLLKSQAWGGLILFTLGAGSSLIFLAGLRCMRGLRIDAVEESMGLDAKLGFRAYVRSTEQARDFQDIVTVLGSCNHTPEQAIEALSSLKKACVLTLTPQAADNKLNGELEDIVGHLDATNLDEKAWESFAFVLHHKKDGGEVVRVFTESFKSTLRKTYEAEPIVKRFAEAKLIFFDDNDGHDLTVLLNHIEHTMNVVILLTRQVLKRPWCIAEITRAHQTGRKILLVQVEWPSKRSDSRSFKMPQDLDEAIQDLTSFASTDSKANAGAASPLGKRSFGFTRSTGSSTTHSPCKDSTTTTHSPCKFYITNSIGSVDDKVMSEQESASKEHAAQSVDDKDDAIEQEASGSRVLMML